MSTTADKKPHPQADPWLRRYLEVTGRANPDGISRGLRPRSCRDCGMTTLAGLDADVAALPLWLHPHPLTVRGEAVALVIGWRTFHLTRHPRALVPTRRTASHIRQRNPNDWDVLHQHHCRARLPADYYKPPPFPVRRGDRPPF